MHTTLLGAVQVNQQLLLPNAKIRLTDVNKPFLEIKYTFNKIEKQTFLKTFTIIDFGIFVN